MKKVFTLFVFLFLSTLSFLQAQTYQPLYSWGRSQSGQLGDGVLEPTPVPGPFGIEWASVAAGENHTLGIKTDGTLWAWGMNFRGQLGDGTTADKNSPVQIGSATDWAAVSAGSSHSIALKKDGTLWAWGSNSVGQLGDGTITSRIVPVNISDAKDWVTVSAGSSHNIAIKTDGTLWAWGSNWYGQIGDGTNGRYENRTIPVQIGVDSDWSSVSAGGSHSIALKRDGTLWTWGRGDEGQLGNGSTDIKVVPEQRSPDSNWISVVAASNNSMAIKADGSLWAWGSNDYGQLGDGTIINKDTPVQVGGTLDWSFVSAGGTHCLAIKTDGTLWAWGKNNEGQLGNGSNTNELIPVMIGDARDWASVDAGGSHTIGIKADGSLLAWGSNSFGKLGNGSNSKIPSQVGSTTNWKAVAAGLYFSLAIETDGTLWAWGSNFGGELGDGTNENKNAPVQIGVDSEWATVSAGPNYSLAIKTDGTLWSWGENNLIVGREGTTTDRNSPLQIGTDTDWATVSAGEYHRLALKTDGTLWAWGNNRNGQLGDGTNENKNTPVQIGTNSDWAAVSAGGFHNLAKKTDGSLWAWGNNGNGQLGDTTTGNKNSPVQIGTGTEWTTIAAGRFHSLAIKADGSLWAWGKNDFGQLGDSTTTDKNVPVQIGTETDWAIISAGEGHNLVQKTNGSLWAWGFNKSGQLGIGDAAHRLAPVQVGNRTEWAVFSAGGSHSLAVLSESKTDQPLLIKPEQDSYSGKNIKVEYILPEAAKAGSVQLSFTWTGGEEDAHAPHIIHVDADLETASQHKIILNGTSLSSSEGVAAVGSTPNDALVDRAVYTVSLSYQDQYEHGTATTENTGFVYDTTPPEAPGRPSLVPDSDTGISSSDKVTAATTPEFQGTAEADAVVTLLINEDKVATCKADADGNWRCATPAGSTLADGSHQVKVTATDEAGNEGTASESLTIVIDTQRPEIEGGQRYSIDENSTSALEVGKVIATDNRSLGGYSISAGNTRDAFAIDATGLITVNNSSALDYETEQEFALTVEAADGAGNIGSEIVRIKLNDVNDAPVITSEAILTAKQGEAYTYQLLATDADLPANTLTYEALEIPYWLSFDVATQVLSGNPAKDVEESSLIRLQVSDGQEVTVQEFILTVELLTDLFERKEQDAPLLVYPNPTKGAIGLNLEDEVAGEAISFSLLNLQGKPLLQQQGSLEEGMEKVNAYLQQAAPGMYLLQLQRKDKIQRVKVMKE